MATPSSTETEKQKKDRFELINKHFLQLSQELVNMAKSKAASAYFFVIASAYIEYLANFYKETDDKGNKYRTFVKNHLYSDNLNKKEIANIMWDALRCGSVHSFSLTGKKYNSENPKQQIVITYRGDNDKDIKGLKHLDKVKNAISAQERTRLIDPSGKKVDIRGAYLFFAEDFAEDIQRATKSLFDKAYNGTEVIDDRLFNNILNYTKKRPPIGTLS